MNNNYPGEYFNCRQKVNYTSKLHKFLQLLIEKHKQFETI